MKFLKVLIPSLFILFFIPQVQAVSVGEALENSLNSENFSYESKFNLDLAGGGSMDMPFDLAIDVVERGGKENNKTGATGRISAVIDKFIDVPEDLGPLSFISFFANFQSALL